MYLAFCGTACEEKFFKKNPTVQPRQGKREVREDCLELLTPSKPRKSTPKVKGREAEGESEAVIRQTPRKRNRAIDDDDEGDDEGSNTGTNKRRCSSRAPSVSSKTASTVTTGESRQEDEESLTSVDDQFIRAIDQMGEADEVFQSMDDIVEESDRSADCSDIAAAIAEKAGESVAEMPLLGAPLDTGSSAESEAEGGVQESASEADASGADAASLQESSAGINAAGEPSAAPPALNHPAPPPSPLDEGFESPDEDTDGPRAVCVNIRSRYTMIQCMAAFVFPTDMMNGTHLPPEAFIESRREAIDLFQVINEISNRKYRLIEFAKPVVARGAAAAPSSGNLVLDLMLPYLRRSAIVEGSTAAVDGVEAVNLHVVHPRAKPMFFADFLEEAFSALCKDLAEKVRSSTDPSRESAVMLYPLFVDGCAIVQPLYNGIILPLALSHGLRVSCLIGLRKTECDNNRMKIWKELKWPTCALVKIAADA